MSLFNKTVKAIDAFESELTAIKTDTSIETQATALTSLTKQAEELKTAMAKFVATAMETDEDKKMYGQGMIDKIMTANSRLPPLLLKLTDWNESVERKLKPILEKERKDQEIQLRQRQEEAERENQERERLRAIQDALRAQQKVEEERRATAAKEKVAEEERQREVEHGVWKLQQEEREKVKQREQKEEALRVEQKQKQDAALASRREAACRMPFSEALLQLKKLMPSDGGDPLLALANETRYKTVVSALKTIVSNVVREPSDPRVLRIPLSNPVFQSHVGEVSGGIECLLSVGFREKRMEGGAGIDKPGQYLVLVEPSLMDIDEWSGWFSRLQDAKTQLEGIK